MRASPSPTGSVRSIASNTSGTLSRPPPPPKPSHLSSAFTGTCNSIALRHYITTHSTGTISRAHLGHGYDTSTLDHFVDAFDSTSDDDDNDQANARPTVRGRTYTAPSVSRIFDRTAQDEDAVDGTARLIRNEPISITGAGPSRVGNLRNLFEAAMPEPPSYAPLSRQNTGVRPTHTGNAAKPKISSHVRMLQAQITGDRFNGIAGAFHVADTRSSIIHETSSSSSQDQDIYLTANQELLGDALKMDAVVMPPISQSPDHAPATISRSAFFRPDVSTQHDRNESSATIRPSHAIKDTAAPPEAEARPSDPSEPVPSTVRVRPSRKASGSVKQGRLSSIFTASPQSSRPSAAPSEASVSPSPSAASIASRSSSQPPSAERSREPSMLLADDEDVSFSHVSHHLRANDGSCFDLDWASPSKAASVRRSLRASPAPSPALNEVEEATIDANPCREHKDSAAQIEAAAASVPVRPPSMRVDAQPSSDAPTITAGEVVQPQHGVLNLDASSTLHADRPTSARMPTSGIGRPARALYDFDGEAAFNELVIRAGQPFEILSEELAGGWSLGLVWDAEGVPTRGLIPQGWYCYIQDFTRSPPPLVGVERPPTPDLVQLAAQTSNVVEPAEVAAPILEQATSAASLPEPAERDDTEHTRLIPGTSLEAESMVKSASRESARISAPVSTDSSGPTVSEPQTPDSNGAVLADDPASPWTSATDNTSKTAQESTQTNGPASAEAVLSKGIDGLPASSAEANSIDWSAMSDSHVWAEGEHTSPQEVLADAHSGGAVPAPELATESTAASGSDWKGSLFGKKTFNRFASFVTSGAEDYVLSSSDAGDEDRSRLMARKVSGGNPIAGATALTQVAEEEDEAAAYPPSTEPVSANDVASASDMQGAEGSRDLGPNHHFVIAGAAGPKWKSKLPCFLVQVHHPEKRTRLNGMQEYTVYHVTSTYAADGGDGESHEELGAASIPYDPLGGPYPPGAQVTVVRRFTQFEWLHHVLAKHYSALLIPPLPEKQYSGRFASDFIETRRADLEMWISRLVRHPVLRYSEPVSFFLACDDEAEWRSTAAQLLREGTSERGAKGGVFANTWHPAFNFDAAEAEVEAERVEAFLRAQERTLNGVGGHGAGKQGVLAAYRGHREGNVALSSTYRDLSYTLLRTLTGAGAGPEHEDGAGGRFEDAHRIHGPPMGNVGRRGETGATNEHGAWCWREECGECVNLTSALQGTAECLQSVAELYEQHAREALLRQHERYKEVSRPHTSAHALLETHRTTLARYREATGEADAWDDADSDSARADARGAGEAAEVVAARCETVLNVTLSEMDRLHDERVQDFHALGRSLLDGEIELYEAVLEQLRAARLHYEPEYYERERDFHVLASRYQPELSRPKRPAPPLLMPSAAQGPPGGLRSAAGGVGLLLSQAAGAGVTRPASIGIAPSSPQASPRRAEQRAARDVDAAAAKAGAAGLMSTLLVPSALRTRTSSGAHAYLTDTTNVQPTSDAAARSSSYFSAIWR